MSDLRNSARRLSSATAIAAIGLAVAFGSTACSAGQVSQTANQLAAVNGSAATVGSMAVRDVHIIYPADEADAVFGNGGPFEIAFLIANESDVDTDRLVSISAPEGTVTIEGDTEIAPNQALKAGAPAALYAPGHTTVVNGVEIPDKRITVTLDGTGETVAPGLTTELVFEFEKAGEVTLHSPVDVGTLQIRQDQVRQAEPPAFEQLQEGHH